MDITSVAFAMTQIGATFSLAPFDTLLQPLIEETLAEQGKSRWRCGTLLIPGLLIWLVLVLTLRRDLNYDQALNWMVSGFRWLTEVLPPQAKLISDGAISHARVKLGVEVFRVLWIKLVASFQPLPADFHGLISVIFDGSTGTMPDTEANRAAFGKPSARTGMAAFPQVRLMGLLAVAQRRLIDIAFAPYTGKSTGERALMRTILARWACPGLLFLMDAGLHAFDVLWDITQKGGQVILKVPAHVKFKRIQRLPDGSWLAELTGKLLDPPVPPTPQGRHHWKTVTLTVRVIRIEVTGFRPFWLMTTLLDPSLTAREIALHYPRRWDIEIAYDEIKTHQCVTLRGQAPTTFRSKLPDLVKQEIYALAITYNLVRTLISQAAAEHDQDPTTLSFLDALQHILDAAPLLTAATSDRREQKRQYLLTLLADCPIDRPRRPRVNPRVVKVKMSKWARKTADHQSERRDIAAQLKIVDVEMDGVTA
jgi:Transposase DDE domain/Insertion element 4 transposase N-terminal